MHRLTIIAAILSALYGCASPGDKPPAIPDPVPEVVSIEERIEKPAPPPAEPIPEITGEQELRAGIAAYENGQHKKSQQSLKNALTLGLNNRSDKITANKYLAFMACANQQREVCKGYFRKALAIDPKFELSKSEAGHPMWSGVFKEVKAEGKPKDPAKPKTGN